jgi:hypothetical protein
LHIHRAFHQRYIYRITIPITESIEHSKMQYKRMRSINRNQQNEGQRITEHKPAAHIYIGQEQVEMERWKEIVTS